MMDAPLIRSYRSADLDPLREVFRQNIPDFFAPSEEQDLVVYLKDHAADYFVLQDQNTAIGGAGFRVSNEGKTGHITWIFFAKKRQGQGLGRLLIQHCLQLLGDISTISQIEVKTSQLAYRFFEKFGFQLIQTEKDYWGPGLDLYFMRKHIGTKAS